MYLLEKQGWQVDYNISRSLFRMVKNRVKEKFLPVFADYAVGIFNMLIDLNVQWTHNSVVIFIYKTFVTLRAASFAWVKDMKYIFLKRCNPLYKRLWQSCFEACSMPSLEAVFVYVRKTCLQKKVILYCCLGLLQTKTTVTGI